MNPTKILHVLALLCTIGILQSCGDDCPDGTSGADCEPDCREGILGMWNVTDIQPAFCTLLSYEFGTRTTDSFIAISIDDGSRVLTGEGLLDSDCSEMTYTVSQGGTIVSGSITFDGNILTDRSDLGCLFTASRQ